jgi:taurine dioxygenase
VIRTHPVTKRKGLYVNSMFTLRFKGWTVAESQPLLEYLFRQVRNHAWGAPVRLR